MKNGGNRESEWQTFIKFGLILFLRAEEIEKWLEVQLIKAGWVSGRIVKLKIDGEQLDEGVTSPSWLKSNKLPIAMLRSKSFLIGNSLLFQGLVDPMSA